ncbi:hypothetical protein HSX11_02230 [Oxalobacteraceae bacterium]|nr:hypothetical protein [Oxalobacteraceae bacterium]
MGSTTTLFLTILSGLVAAAVLCSDARAGEGARNLKLAVAEVPASDFVPFPAVFRKMESPDGRYVFEVRSTDGWKTTHAVGRLLENAAAGRRVIWEKVLPQEYGPRYFLVGRQGQVVLFDESINVKSRYAIVLMQQPETHQVVHDFDAVRRALELSAATLTELARGGWWLQGAPSLDPSGAQAIVPAGDKFLGVDLISGQLFLVNEISIRK